MDRLALKLTTLVYASFYEITLFLVMLRNDVP